MNEISEHVEANNPRRIFSKLSLINSLISLGFYSWIYFYSTPGHKESIREEGITIVGIPIMTVVILLFLVLGVVMTILSFVKKEPRSWYKWLGGILNILCFLVPIALAVLFMI